MIKEKSGIAGIIIVLGLIAAVIMLAGGGSNEAELDKITVSGDGKITMAPDEAEVYIDIITESSNAKDAEEENAEILEKVTAALKAKGVSADDIETSNYNLYPKTTWNSATGKSDIYGYRLTHQLKITTKDIKNTGDIVDAAVRSGANGLNNVNFRLSDSAREKAYKEALEKASNSAKAKAESMSAALGFRLAKIVSVSESGISYAPYRYYGAQSNYALGVETAESYATVISPSDVEVTAYVSVAYEIA